MTQAKQTTAAPHKNGSRPRQVRSKSEPRMPATASMGDFVSHVVSKIPAMGADRAAALLARMFYRQMRRQGCTETQVIKVASEIIRCLNKSLKGLEDRQD